MPSEEKNYTSVLYIWTEYASTPAQWRRKGHYYSLPFSLFEAKKYFSSIRQAPRQTGEQVVFHSKMDLIMKQSQQSGQNRNITLNHL